MINFKKNIIIIFSIGISSVQNVAFASVETFIEGWYFGSLDAICMTYQFGEVSERLAIDHFKRIFNMIEKDKKLDKKTKDKFYSYGNSENLKDCKKFLPY